MIIGDVTLSTSNKMLRNLNDFVSFRFVSVRLVCMSEIEPFSLFRGFMLKLKNIESLQSATGLCTTHFEIMNFKRIC